MHRELIEKARDAAEYAKAESWGAISHIALIDELVDALEAVEQAWEYGLRAEILKGNPIVFPTRESAQHVLDNPDMYREWSKGKEFQMVRRLKAGQWEEMQ